MKRQIQVVKVAAVLAALGLSGCSEFSVDAINLNSKNLVLKESRVLEDSRIPKSSEDDTDAGDEPAPADADREQPKEESTAGEEKVPAQVSCLSTRAPSQPGEAAQLPEPTMKMTLYSVKGGPSCSFDNVQVDLKKIPHEIGLGEVSLDNCKTLASGQYQAVVTSSSLGEAMERLVIGMRSATVQLTRSGANAANLSIASSQLRSDPAGPMIPVFISNVEAEDPAVECDVETDKADPLVIDLNEAADGASVPLPLTSAIDGIMFDILGSTNNYVPVPVAWINRTKPTSHYFVVLPDSSGRVRGIDQLFGDHTKGPDNLTATDGFAALAKYDGRRTNGTNSGSIDAGTRDGMIDSRDAVFSKLRFWNDRNGNGLVDSGELKTASELKLTAIDLRYDPKFREVDKHGNVAKYKSVARTSDGKLHVVFDLLLKLR